MRKIPDTLREEMANDPYYAKCCLSYLGNCSGHIQWHHNLIHAGRQVNEKWCILPVCVYHHEHEKDKDIGEQLDYIMLCRATQSDLTRFSKAVDYNSLKERLTLKYGK